MLSFFLSGGFTCEGKVLDLLLIADLETVPEPSEIKFTYTERQLDQTTSRTPSTQMS